MGSIPIFNLSPVSQGWGSYTIPPRRSLDVPKDLAIQLAEMPDYRCDSEEILDTYPFSKDGLIHLGWSGPFWYPDGYGSISQEIASYLCGMAGVKAIISPRDYHPGMGKCGGHELKDWTEKAFVPENIVEALSSPQEKALYGINFTWPRECHRSVWPRTIGYTMFETDSCPIDWVRSMNLCRRIMVPSAHCIQAFQNRGVTTPMHVVPQGVNPDAWPVIDRSEHTGPFTFLIAGGLTHRKNPIGAVRAFLCAFPEKQDVRLLVKTRAGEIVGGFQNWLKQIPKDDRIVIIAENSTPRDMLTYFGKADAFVWPSRGEGYGLTPVQAMSTGLPVIVSDNSGMSQFCDPRYNYPISCKTVKVPDQQNGGYPDVWGDCGNWWEPNFDELVETMRSVYKHQGKARRKGQRAAEWVREKWTIGHICQKILEVVCDDAKESGLEW